jgi:hypothetical protein
VLVFFCEIIKLIIIYTKAQATVRLGDKKHKRNEKKAVKHNKTFVKVFLASIL